jgi:hypothetical protein
VERELEELLSRGLDGVLSDDEVRRFESLVNENSEFRNEYLTLLRQERVARTLLDVDGGLNVADQLKLKVKASASGEKFVARIHNEIDKKKRADGAASNVIKLPEPKTPDANRFSNLGKRIAVVAALLLLILGLSLAMKRISSNNLAFPNKPKPRPAEQTPPKEIVQTPAPKKSNSTYVAVASGERGAPMGYWEFLPSAYHSNKEQKLAVVIFFHGLEEGGNGSSEDLKKVLKHGPPAMLADAAHPLHDVFDTNNVIVLAPQCKPAPEWWHAGDMIAFMDYAFARYRDRIDRRRVYLTGLSAGALGIHELMDVQPEKAHQAAAILVTSTVGGVGSINQPFAGPGVGAAVPYWALTSVGDKPDATIAGMNKIAGLVLGKPPTDLMKTYPGEEQIQTATFNPKTGWTWERGLGTSSNATLRLTLYPGKSHASFQATYDTLECWNWLFAQRLTPGDDLLDKF